MPGIAERQRPSIPDAAPGRLVTAGSATRTTLMVCRLEAHAELLARLEPREGQRYIVASDDIGLHERGRHFPFISEVTWLEKKESHYCVDADVLALLEIVNGWLRSLGDRGGFPADILCWMQHIEGGATTQRLLDALLLIRSYAELFERHNVTDLVICGDPAASFEDAVLLATARSGGIAVETVARRHPEPDGPVKRLRTAARQTVGALLYRPLKTTARVFKMKAAVAWQSRRNHDVAKAAVAFQLASPDEKHFENVSALMGALRERGADPLVLSSLMPEVAAKVRGAGFAAEDVAHFVPLTTLGSGLFRLWVTLVRALRNKTRLTHDEAFRFRGVPLGEVLWTSVLQFLLTEPMARFFVFRGLKEFYRRRRPAAMKLWGEVALPEGYLAWKALPANHRPLFFDYWLGVGLVWPFWRRDTPVDLYLSAGRIQTKLLALQGVAPERIVTVGSLRYDDVRRLPDPRDQPKSRQLLGIPDHHRRYILWDPGLIIRGFATQQEQLSVAEALLDLARDPWFALIVKPHPSHNSPVLDRRISARALPNVYVVPSATLPYEAMNATDIVLTKYSTIGVEAMLLDRPVISVMLDDEMRWRAVFEDGVEYVSTLEQMHALLTRLCDDPAYYDDWRARRLRSQRAFLDRYFQRGERSATATAADVLARALRLPSGGRPA